MDHLDRNAAIAREQLTRYLLVAQAHGHESAFLASDGYSQDNPDDLLQGLREQILPLEASPTERNEFGQMYEMSGSLRGPNGVTLRIRTIWMVEHASGITRFITLIPEKRSG